jgi:AcrR family transcriptional regulator
MKLTGFICNPPVRRTEISVDSATEERWRDLRRTRLLDAAGRVFARLGYEAASVEDIAFEAGVGKPTVYRYFASKESLFEAAFAQTLDELEGRLDAALEVPGPFPDVLRRLIGEIVPTFRTHVVSMNSLSEGGETSRRRLFRQRRGRIEARLVNAIQTAQVAGEIRAFEPSVAARLMIGMVWSGTNSTLPDDASVVAAVVDFTMRGLARDTQP